MKNLLILVVLVADVYITALAQEVISDSSQNAKMTSNSNPSPDPSAAIQQLLGNNVAITALEETAAYWWVGSKNGLYRIKKKSLKVIRYNLRNYSLSSNTVTCICVNSDGHVYIGTDAGIVHYDRYAFFPISTENSRLPSNTITALDCMCKTGVRVQTDGNEHWNFIKY